ncbi:stalk domain-containing protein [Brevibacillus daliensis]|uniref:stalk domain-containing protein n=1 Tax=Brevibacillus daliensis TaxID=2892995 RepID=UPI001E2D665A|nr:stalk domain-containing protein [Brevibacillus daliensis]
MKPIQKLSLYVCLSLFSCFAIAATYMNAPEIKEWVVSVWPKPVSSVPVAGGADPFRKEELLPPIVRDLQVHYKINADLDTSQSRIKGNVEMSFDNPNTKKIHLYYYGYKWNEDKLSMITYKGKSIPFVRRDHIILMDNPAPTEKRVTINVGFETQIPRGPTRFGTHENIWTLTHWYPMLGALDQQNKWYEPPQVIGYGDPYIYHYADYEVQLVAPADFKWVTSAGKGEQKKQEQNKKRTTWQFASTNLLNFTLVGSPDFLVESVKITPDLTVDIASKDKNHLNKLKEITKDALPIFSKQMGPLAQKRISVAETGNKTVYAMEYANMAIVASHLYDQNQLEHWLPHELAHLWWYNSVGTVEPLYGWIDEGLVEASVAFYHRQKYGQEAGNKIFAQYEQEEQNIKERYPYGKLSKQLTQFADYYEFDGTWYSTGAQLYEELRKQIGDELFFSFLQRLHQDYRFKVIGPAQMDQALGSALNAEAQYFVPNTQKLNKDKFLPLAADYYVKIVLGSRHFYPETPGRLRSDVVYLPLREMLEQLGFEVSANDQTGEIIAKTRRDTFSFKEDSHVYKRNGEEVAMSAPLIEWRDRSLLPLSFFKEGLGLSIQYDTRSRTVTIQ